MNRFLTKQNKSHIKGRGTFEGQLLWWGTQKVTVINSNVKLNRIIKPIETWLPLYKHSSNLRQQSYHIYTSLVKENSENKDGNGSGDISSFDILLLNSWFWLLLLWKS